MARTLGAISKDEFYTLNDMLVRHGLNDPANCKLNSGESTTIKNGDIIQGYTILMTANGTALAYSETAPDPYVVWNITENGDDVYGGRYGTNKEDAEWDFCRKAFPWFEDNAPINIIEEKSAEQTDSFNWHLDDAKERVDICRSVLDEIQQAIDSAAVLVEDMVAEHNKLLNKIK